MSDQDDFDPNAPEFEAPTSDDFDSGHDTDVDAGDEEGLLEGPTEAETEAEELEEIERNGKKYKIPTALKSELLMQQDYTRKTQEVAEQRRAIEAEQQALEERTK